MNHIDEGTIHAWLDGALDPAQAAGVDAHIASCAQCAAAVAEARGFIAGSSRILRALDGVPANVIPSTPPVTKQKRMWRAAPWVTGIAALLVLAVTLTVQDQDSPSDTQIASAPITFRADSAKVEAAITAAPEVAQGASAPAQTLASRAAQGPRERASVPTVGGGIGSVGGSFAADPAANVAAKTVVDRTVAGDSALERRAVRQDARAEQVAVTSAPTISAGAAAQAPPPTVALEPQRSKLLDMRTIRPIDPLRDSIPEYARLAGCYVVITGERSAPVTQDFASARGRAAAERQAPAAAPRAAMESRASNRLVIRLDSLMGRPGYIVRAAASDSSLGWWMPVRTDSARVDLLAAGMFGLTPGQKVECPENR